MADDDGTIGAISDAPSVGGGADITPSAPAQAPSSPSEEPAATIDTADRATLTSDATQSSGEHGNDGLASAIGGWARPGADGAKGAADVVGGAKDLAGDGEAKGAKDAGDKADADGDKAAKNETDAKSTDGKDGAKDDPTKLDPSKGDLKRGAGLGKDGPSDDVKNLQKRLGMGDQASDGKFGPKTQKAVADFQKKNNLPVTGTADRATMDALNNPKPAGQQAAGATQPAGAAQQTGGAQQGPLNEKDQKTADFLSKYIKANGGKGIPDNIGEMIVRSAQAHNVDPMALAAIPGNETHWGKTGIGTNGMAGAGAYDKNPRNALTNPKFAGPENQIEQAARAFERNRDRFGGSADQPIAAQLKAANGNGRGYATTTSWWKGVNGVYNRLLAAQRASGE